MIRIDSTTQVDPYNGTAIDITTNEKISARHPKAGAIVKALSALDIATNALAALNACDLSAPYVRDFLKSEIPTTLPFLFTEKPARRIDSTRSKKIKTPAAPKSPQIPTTPEPPSNIIPFAATRIVHNSERDGIEITFNTKPSAETLATLKQKGFRWSSRQQLWYCPHTPDIMSWTETTFGSKDNPPTVSNLVKKHDDDIRIDSTQSTDTCGRYYSYDEAVAKAQEIANQQNRNVMILPIIGSDQWIIDEKPTSDWSKAHAKTLQPERNTTTPPHADRIDSTQSVTPAPAAKPTPAQLIAAMLAAKSKK